MIEVVNQTPEPDGSYRHHFLGADPQLRPDAVFDFEVAAGGPQLVQNRERRATSP